MVFQRISPMLEEERRFKKNGYRQYESKFDKNDIKFGKAQILTLYSLFLCC